MAFSHKHNLFYAFGTFGIALSYQAFVGWIQFFYLDELNLLPIALSLAWIGYTIWNMLNDPLLGHLSDVTKTPFGRRIPWIVVLCIPIGITFFLLWSPPTSIVAIGGFLFSPLWWYFVIALLLFDTVYSAITINYLALFPEMFEGQQRTTNAGWRQVFLIIGGIVGVSMTKEVAESLGWAGMGILFGSLITLSFMISLLGSREKPDSDSRETLQFVQSIKETLKRDSFRWFILVSIGLEFTLLMLATTLPLYAKYVLLESDGLRQGLLSGVAFLTAIPFFGVWTWAAKKWESRSLSILSLILTGLTLLPLVNILDYTHALIMASAFGGAIAGIVLFREVMLADVVDEDSLSTNTRREGIFFGINGFISRAAFGLQGVILGGVLTFVGYNSVEIDQPSSVVLGIRGLIAIIPMFGIFLSLIGLRQYPLYGDRLKEVKDAKVT